MVKLATQSYGNPATDTFSIWILHGIMGSKQNWSRWARDLSQRFPKFKIITIDLRCHGHTPKTSGPHTLEACVDDLYDLAYELGHFPNVVIGHSFGGKVTICYAKRNPQNLNMIWTLDSSLENKMLTAQNNLLDIIETCESLTLPIPSRQFLVERLTQNGLSLGTAQWMTTNLEAVDLDDMKAGFKWLFDLSGIKSLLSDFWHVDGIAMLGQISPEVEIYLLRAEKGLRWDERMISLMKANAPHVHLPILKDAGHWVHIDQPKPLLEMIADSLKDFS
jgi:pimeloyl-ACP methyl ester carboxylesterase